MIIVAKYELIFAGPVGLATILYKSKILVNKRSSKNAEHSSIKAINEEMMLMKPKGFKLLIFPEGKRLLTGEINQFKKGAFYAAIHAQVPILPIVFSNYELFVDLKKKQFHPATVTVSIMDEIPTDGLTVDDVDELIAKTHQLMSAKFKQISGK